MKPPEKDSTAIDHDHRPMFAAEVVSRVRLRQMPAIARSAFGHVLAVITGSYLRTLASAAVIHDHAGRVLLAQTTYGRRAWDLPGGRVERAETPEAGLVREILEETGLEIAVERLLVVDMRQAGSVVLVFLCRLIGGSMVPGPGEIRRLRWFDEDELRENGILDEGRVDVALAAAADPGSGVRYLSAPTIR